MSDIDILKDQMKTRLQETSKKARALGEGLQGAAPGGGLNANPSVQYLLKAADQLEELAAQVEQLSKQKPTTRFKP